MSSRFGASNPRYIFKVRDLGIETRVVSFHAIEGISEPFEVNITIAASASKPIAFEKVAECEALLTIYSYEDDYGAGENTRYFHGVINKLKYAGRQGAYCLYRLRLVPYLWFLNLSHSCRIYQEKTIEDICEDIFEQSKMRGEYKFVLNIAKNKEEKEYCVQYNESNLNFVARILEEAGIFYFFEHSNETHQIVFADTAVQCDVITGDDEIPLGHPNMDNPNQEIVTAFNLSERFVTGKFSHTSYNYDNASQKLDVSKIDEIPGAHEHYIHDGNFVSESDGEITAAIRLEENTMMQLRAKGASSCARFTPGYKFSLDSDVNSEFVDEYILLAVEHMGEQPQVLEEDGHSGGSLEYENGFLCVPSDTEIRPPRITPKPVITGLQSAIVTGPKGEEIYTDEYGRVCVQFHWDRLGQHNENSSCMLRVAQVWGGGGWGAQFIPRIGDEVLVDFLEGDPDRPIVTGCVYNSDNLPINSLKKSITQSGFRTKTHKGDGFNELRFDDANGAQEIYLHGEKNLNVTIKNDETKTVGNNLVNQAGKTATISAGEQLQLVCGSAIIVLDQSGKITVNGTEISAISAGPMNLAGSQVKIN